jgi:hypothetical protein
MIDQRLRLKQAARQYRKGKRKCLLAGKSMSGAQKDVGDLTKITTNNWGFNLNVQLLGYF